MRVGPALLLVFVLGCGAKTELQVERIRDGGTGARDATAPPDADPPVDLGALDGCEIVEPTILVELEPGAGLFHVSTDETHAYMAASQQGRVLRAPLCGGPLEVIAEGRSRPFYVLSDGEFAYWTDANGAGSVNRAPVEGGPVQELWAEGGQPETLAMDDGFLYFSVAGIDSPTMGLWRLAKDGSEHEQIVVGQVGRAVVAHERWIYFFRPIEQTLLRLTREGGTPDVVARGAFTGGSLVVHEGFAYWTAWSGGPNVLRAPLPSGPVEVLAEGESRVVQGLAVDDGHVYWTSQLDGAVRGLALREPRAAPTTIARGQETVESLAIGPEGALFWVNFGDDRAWRAPPL